MSKPKLRADIATRFQKGHQFISGGEKYWFRKGEGIGNDNPKWKGDEAGYAAIHKWVQRQKGKAIRCENTDCTYPRRDNWGRTLLKPKKFHWANISHKYKRDVNDWMQLCQSCHFRYDRGSNKWGIIKKVFYEKT